MAVPTISSTSPADGATDVFVNSTVELTFENALLETSITKNSIVLLNVNTNDVAQYSLSYNSTSNKVTVAPLGVLTENTVYKVRIVGSDIAISSSLALQGADGISDVLTSTATIEFTTGTRVFIDDTIVAKETTDLSLEGDLTLASNVKALGEFDIVTTTPKNHAYDVSQDIDGNNKITLEFTKNISGSITDDWLTIDVFSMLDNDSYLASGSTFNTGIIPAMTGLTCSGKYIYATFSDDLPKNVGVEVTVEPAVTATDGSQFGSSLYKLSFATDRYPKIGGVHVIEREIKAATDELNREYVSSLLFKNTIDVMQRYAVDQNNPSFVAHKYVINKTIVDILDDKELEKALVAGTRRQLGDLNVSIDAIIGRLSLKHTRALKNIDMADRTMHKEKYIARKVNQVMYSPYYDRPNKLWYGVNGRLTESRWKTYQGNYPASNIAVNRQSKIGPGSDWI